VKPNDCTAIIGRQMLGVYQATQFLLLTES